MIIALPARYQASVTQTDSFSLELGQLKEFQGVKKAFSISDTSESSDRLPVPQIVLCISSIVASKFQNIIRLRQADRQSAFLDLQRFQ